MDDFLPKLEKGVVESEHTDPHGPLESALWRICVELARTNLRLEEVPKGESAIERLTTAPGVGIVVAFAFVSVIDDAKSFADAHQVESYLCFGST